MKCLSLIACILISLPAFSQLAPTPLGTSLLVVGSLYDPSTSLEHQFTQEVLDQNEELVEVKDSLDDELSQLWNNQATHEELEMLKETIEICNEMIDTNQELLTIRFHLLEEILVDGD